MRLTLLPGTFAVCRLDASRGTDTPSWFHLASPVSAVVRRGDELSLVCPDEVVPADDDVRVERGWKAFEVEGPMEFTLTGVLASIASPLADADVGIFAMATYDTDVVLVPGARLDDAVAALRAAGHTVDGSPRR